MAATLAVRKGEQTMVVNCEHVWQAISDYLEGEVSPELRAAMEAHFKECKHCTAVLNGTRNVVEVYGDDQLFELPAGFDARLRRRLAQVTQAARVPRTSGHVWMLAVAAAALIAGGFTLARSSAAAFPVLLSEHARPAVGIPAGLMVAVSEDGKTFHVPGCKYLHKHDNESPKLMAAADAIREGYVPCVRCLRKYLAR
jgi:anti-sigma factor RsiW